MTTTSSKLGRLAAEQVLYKQAGRESCKHCDAMHERGDNGKCNTCGKTGGYDGPHEKDTPESLGEKAAMLKRAYGYEDDYELDERWDAHHGGGKKPYEAAIAELRAEESRARRSDYGLSFRSGKLEGEPGGESYDVEEAVKRYQAAMASKDKRSPEQQEATSNSLPNYYNLTSSRGYADPHGTSTQPTRELDWRSYSQPLAGASEREMADWKSDWESFDAEEAGEMAAKAEASPPKKGLLAGLFGKAANTFDQMMQGSAPTLSAITGSGGGGLATSAPPSFAATQGTPAPQQSTMASLKPVPAASSAALDGSALGSSTKAIKPKTPGQAAAMPRAV